MQQGSSWTPVTPAPTPTSRRALRAAGAPTAPVLVEDVARVASRREQRSAATDRSARTAPRWVPRAAILSALATATIAVPLVGVGVGDPALGAVTPALAAAAYPSAVEVLAADLEDATPTSLLAVAPGAVRAADTVSRSVVRDPLPGCDGQARAATSNGQIPASDLCALWDGDQMLRGDAAVSLAELNGNFNAAFGRDLCITDSYRSLAEQRRVAWTKPGLAATPGTSNHGWGLAIDLCTSENRSSAVMTWLSDNGPTYGWDNPDWARRGGSGAYEPWHWEYVPGTTALGTNY